MYKALIIARYVIRYCRDRGYYVSNLKLQKILYFIQAEFLTTKGIPCFSDRIEAWDFGPVVPAVYHEYKHFGSSNIIEEIDEIPTISTIDQGLINGKIEECNQYSASQLVDFTHHQTPWLKAYKKYCNNVIGNDAIKEFFSE